MKLLLTALLCCFSVLVFSQKKYIPDDVIYTDGVPGNYRIMNDNTGKALAVHIKVDEIVTNANHGLIGFRKGEKYGFMNIYGKIVVPAQFDAYDQDETAYPLPTTWSNLYWLVRKEDKSAMLDSTGAYVIPFGDYDALWDGERGVCVVEKDYKIGLFRKGKMILPIEYNADSYESFTFSEEVMPIDKDTLRGLINSKGKFVLPVEYSFIRMATDSFYIVTKNNKSGLTDLNGKTVLPVTFDEIYNVINGYVYAKKNGLNGIQKLDGTIIAPYEYDEFTTDPKDGLIFVRKGELWGTFSLIDRKAPELIYTSFYTPRWTPNNIVALKKGDYWGIINSKNEVLCDFLYESTDYNLSFSYAGAVVRRNGKYGLISPLGKLVIPCEIDEITSYQYFPANLQKNGKWGRLNSNGVTLIPFEYDSIIDEIATDAFQVVKMGKMGIYIAGDTELMPTLFDRVTFNSPYYETAQNGKFGLYTIDGKQLTKCIYDEILSVSETLILVKENGILKQLNTETGKEQALSPEEETPFETVTFVRFMDNNGNRIYCIDNATKRLVGKPYANLGLFDDKGRAVARPADKDYDIAINTKGEDLKSRFHLETEFVFDAMIEDTIRDTIIAQFAKRGFFNADSIIDVWAYIERNYFISVEPGYWYDEYGNELYTNFLAVYNKGSYYSYDTPFPANPNYEYNFQDYYSATSMPNENGWRWAFPKSMGYDYEYDHRSVDLNQAFLVNDSGEEIIKDNYVPVTSKPFYEFNLREIADWSALKDYPVVMDSLRKHFPSGRSLSDADFLKSYKDSVHHNSFPDYGYDPETGDEMEMYEFAVYKMKNLQLFIIPPPTNVTYRFEIHDINKMKGGEKIKVNHSVDQRTIDGDNYSTDVIDWNVYNRFDLFGKTAYAFGKRNYFVYPDLDNIMDTTGARQKIDQLKMEETDPKRLEDFSKFDYFTKLVQSGLAQSNSGYEPYTEFGYKVYWYDYDMGFAIENEVVLQPGYSSIALQPQTLEMPYLTQLVLVDSMLNVFNFNTLTRKLTKVKDDRFCSIKSSELITQNIHSRLYTIHDRGIVNESPELREDYFEHRTLTGIKRIIDKRNCNYMNYYTMEGEDSMAVIDGVLQFVYLDFCDTIVNGPYSTFYHTPGITWYEMEDGRMFDFWNHEKVDLHISENTLQTFVPINDIADRLLLIREKQNGLQLVNLENKTLNITDAEYQKLLNIQEGQNGFGGIARKGVFIPYQTMVPFPEKHKVYTRVSFNCWLVGKKGKLQLVELSEGGITRRYEKTFKSYADYKAQLAKESEENSPIYLFLNSWMHD